jgi:Transposase DDE domain
MTLRVLFGLADRQAEGLTGPIISLLGLTLRVPAHTTLSRRAATLAEDLRPAPQSELAESVASRSEATDGPTHSNGDQYRDYGPLVHLPRKAMGLIDQYVQRKQYARPRAKGHEA